MRVFVDTNLLVAAQMSHHPFHSRAKPVMDIILEGSDHGLVAAHSLLEMYSVLTRYPANPRITPHEAGIFLKDNILPHFEVINLTLQEHINFVKSLSERNVSGGMAYDALLLRCAEKARVDRLYTFNVGHFRSLASPDMARRITAP